jgi:hypothetical protein
MYIVPYSLGSQKAQATEFDTRRCAHVDQRTAVTSPIPG